MRIFVYGLQSSGASLFALFLAQLRNSLAVIDTWADTLAPGLQDIDDAVEHVIVKSVITTKYTARDHMDSFDADISILLVRHPAHNYVALSRKWYGPLDGSIDEKFRILEKTYQSQGLFDSIVSYESFLSRDAATLANLRGIGIPVEKWFYHMRRSHRNVTRFNQQASSWCRTYFKRRWGTGNIKEHDVNTSHAFKFVPSEVRAKTAQLCPTVIQFSEMEIKRHFSAPYILFRSFFSDMIARRLSATLKSGR